jgi:FkbM family methyltransferase
MIQKFTDKRSLKIKFIDYLFFVLYKSSVVKNKIKIICERGLNTYHGFKFSYDSTENGEQEFINHLASIYGDKNFYFFDVGAHYGSYTKLVINNFINYFGELFEPTPESFKRLGEEFNSNSKLKLNNLALSNFNGKSYFITYPDDETRNGLVGVGRELTFVSNDILCSVVKGDDYCDVQNIKNISLLKIDAEGHDFNVIKGFENLISNGCIDIIQFEYTFKHSDLGITLRNYYDFFQNYGYKIGPLRKYGVDFYYDFDSRLNQYEFGPNYVAVKNELVESLAIY